ncbi:MAG: SLC13/DASS family transporter [Planctomycetes bacterium]|nr:SLC13/DASS family transporter [Planctomycetota bacterium]
MTSAEPVAREVHGGRIAFAVLLAALAWWFGDQLPFPAGTDPGPARALLFTTVLTTTCWLASAMPIAAASLLPLVLLPVLGVQSTAATTQGYGHPILWLFGGGFVLALAVERCGLHRRLALRILASVGPSPRRLVFGFFLAATLISLWINNTSVALLLLPIGMVLVERTLALGELSPAAARNFGAGVMCAIAYGASIGGIGTPIGTAPNALFFGAWDKLVAQGAPAVSFFGWTLAFAPFALLLTVAGAWLMTRVALPIPGARLRGGEQLLAEAMALPPWSPAEKRTAWLFLLAVLLWMTRGDVVLGGGDVLHGWAHWLIPAGQRDSFIADGSVAIAVAVLAFLIPAGTRDGARLIDWEGARKLPFDLLFLLGAGIAMADAFEPTRVSHAFGELLKPAIVALHPVLLLLVIVMAITMLSEVASNTAIATLLLPILKDGALAAKIDPLVLMLPATIAASCGFMLPIATPPNTIVFASRRLTFGQMARAGFLLDLLAALLLLPVLWFWSLPLLGVQPGAPPTWLPAGGGK